MGVSAETLARPPVCGDIHTIARTLGDMASGGRKEGENGAPGSMSRNAAMIAGIGAAVIVGGYAYSIISAVMRR